MIFLKPIDKHNFHFSLGSISTQIFYLIVQILVVSFSNNRAECGTEVKDIWSRQQLGQCVQKLTLFLSTSLRVQLIPTQSRLYDRLKKRYALMAKGEVTPKQRKFETARINLIIPAYESFSSLQQVCEYFRNLHPKAF